MEICSLNNSKTMNLTSTRIKENEWKSLIFSTLTAGLGMWIVGGLYHNLVLPSINESISPHHEGLGITLIAYFILAYLMTYLYSIYDSKSNSIFKGVKLGVVLGILWVFPHGLAMAGTHNTSIAYEFKNTLYHIFEQGIGGIIIYFVGTYFNGKK